LFHCEQAVEKSLKALWIERAEEGFPPRTHDLVSLADEIGLELSEEQRELLRYLHEVYTSSRYPEEEELYTSDGVRIRYDQTREFVAWLQQQLS
jgi:HEPN domain-containing protein